MLAARNVSLWRNMVGITLSGIVRSCPNTDEGTSSGEVRSCPEAASRRRGPINGVRSRREDPLCPLRGGHQGPVIGIVWVVEALLGHVGNEESGLCVKIPPVRQHRGQMLELNDGRSFPTRASGNSPFRSCVA